MSGVFTNRRGYAPARAPRARRPAWAGRVNPLALALKALVLVLGCAAVVVPFVGVISTSLAPQSDLNAAGGFVLWPHHPTFDAYRVIFSGGIITRAIWVSVGITLVGTAISVFTTVLLAYGLSRPGSFAHKPLLLLTLFTLLFSPGLIPSYLMVKQLGLINSYWSLILPVAVNAFNVIVVRAFFMDIPSELRDASRIDGAGDLAVLRYVILPLSKAVISVVSLFYAVGYWNAFFNAQLYINDTTKWPLQLVLRQFVIQGDQYTVSAGASEIPPPQQAIQMAILVISVVPILLAYPFFQRHFTKGVLTGAVKG